MTRVLLKVIGRRDLTNRARRKHEHAHFILDAVNAVGLDHYIDLIETTRRHEQVSKIDLDVVHAGLELEIMSAPRPALRDIIDHDGRGAEIKKKREWKKTGLNLHSVPGLLLCGHELILLCLGVKTSVRALLPDIPSAGRVAGSDHAVADERIALDDTGEFGHAGI